MKNILKISLCIILMLSTTLSLAGCSSKTEMTKENVTQTVSIALDALHEFDSKNLEKYVDSQTLAYIINLSKDHEQFAELGRAMFASLSIEVDAIDLDAKTVTVKVMNKDLYSIASCFAFDLTNNHSTFELLSLLKDDFFLDESLAELTNSINEAPEPYEYKTVTLSITQGKRNLVLSVDDEAEDAISGGALYAVKNIVQ